MRINVHAKDKASIRVDKIYYQSDPSKHPTNHEKNVTSKIALKSAKVDRAKYIGKNQTMEFENSLSNKIYGSIS